MIDYPKNLQIIFDKLQKHNAKPILIGGFVRDSILKKEVKDIDIEVYGISSFKKLEDILKEFGSVNIVGKSFGVCKLRLNNLELDFSLPRIDSKTSSGHRGFDVKINSNLDFKSAALRRDFTINAIGYDVSLKKILDPFDGLKDLKAKILRAVNETTFIEDPLRILRAVQFCARFELEMDRELFLLCSSMIENHMLDELANERVYKELEKLLIKSQKPSIGFKLLKELNALKYFTNITLDAKTYSLMMDSLDEFSKLKTTNKETNITLMLSILCYFFDINFIKNLINEKKLLDNIISLMDNYSSVDLKNISDFNLFKLATKVNIEEFLQLARALHFAKNGVKVYEDADIAQKRAIALNILNFKMPALLRGKDILECGIKASKDFSHILNIAYEAQMNGDFNSKDEAITWLKNYLNTNYTHLLR